MILLGAPAHFPHGAQQGKNVLSAAPEGPSRVRESWQTKMRLLNLFSGTDSVAIPWREAGHEVTSVDIDPRYNPEICEDILQLSYCKLETPDVICASPPCDQFAQCRARAKTS